MQQPALLIRLDPAGPWRYGPGDGGQDRVDDLYRSDRLFSALTLTFERLGCLEEWLDATVRAPRPAVVFSSLYPFQGDTLFAIPPASLWPPPAAQLSAPNSVFLAKIRWKTARFVPLSLIDTLLTGGLLLADQWLPDPDSGCLLRRDRPSTSPFRLATRTGAAVDRLGNPAELSVAAACIEFEPGAGLWTVARYRDSAAQNAWDGRVQAAFRLLADSGFGGRRSNGWGHARQPQFQSGSWPGILLPKTGRLGKTNGTSDHAAGIMPSYWLLSLYSPASGDEIDWRSGEYSVAVRSGRVDSRQQVGASKQAVRMIVEGSVLVASSEPAGAAVDVAPANFGHPVFRSGLSLALEVPSGGPETTFAEAAEPTAIEEEKPEPEQPQTPADEAPELPPSVETALQISQEQEPVVAEPEPSVERPEDSGATSEDGESQAAQSSPEATAADEPTAGSDQPEDPDHAL